MKFTKMHSLGNDFIVIDAIHQHVQLTSSQITALSQRETGIGFDQCLLVEASQQPEIDFLYRIFNANGQEVGQCGNGARCLARFIHRYDLSHKSVLKVGTSTTQMQLELHADDTVTVTLPPPKLAPQDIPLHVPKQAHRYAIPLSHEIVEIHAVNVGNPHAVMLVEDITHAPIQTLGPQLSKHPLFPEQSNVGFMQILTPEHIKLRVYERGCGETLACGSGAVAATVIGRLYYDLASTVTVSLPGGDLMISWPDTSHPIALRGPATFVYEGTLCESLS